MNNQSQNKELEKIIATHIQKLGASHFVRQAEIEEILQVIDSEIRLRVLTRYIYTNHRTGENRAKLVHRLSFDRREGKLSHFPLNRNNPYRYEILLKDRKIDWQHPLILLIPTRYRFPEETRVRIQQHLNILITQTQIWRNLQKDHTTAIINKFNFGARHLLSRPEDMTITKLCDALLDQFEGTVAIGTRTHEGEPCGSTYSQFKYKQGKFTISHCTGSFKDDKTRIEQILNSNSIQHLCTEALLGAKVIDATDDANLISNCKFFKHFLMLPFSRSTDIKARRLQLILLVKEIDHPENLSYADVLAAQEIVSLYNKNVSLNIQGQILSDLAYILTDLQSFPEMYWSKPLDRTFRNIATTLSEVLVRATQAHSCTFRMVDLAHEKLERIAYYDESGTTLKGEDISLTLKNSSLNVFTYFEFKNFYGSCYVPISNCIPKELSERGLTGCLNCRVKSQSEICFAIILNSAPVGTINLESPALHGFDDDISFLGTVSMLVSSVYNALVDLFDSRFISERLSVLNRHHDLRNYIDRIESLDKSFANFLKNTYLPGLHSEQDEHPEKQRRIRFHIKDLVNDAKIIFSASGTKAVDEALDIWIDPDMPEVEGARHYKTALGHVIEHLVSNSVHYNMLFGRENSSLRIEFSYLFSNKKPETRLVAFGSLKARNPHKDRHLSIGKPSIKLLKNRIVDNASNKDIMIELHYRINSTLSKSVAQNLGRRLVINPNSGKKRLGFFIVGLLVRKLGGNVTPIQDNKSGSTIVKITIPARHVENI